MSLTVNKEPGTAVANRMNVLCHCVTIDPRRLKEASGGYASKAVYRGDKLTTTRWAEIREGSYIAQEFAEPSKRAVLIDGEAHERKVDFRLYTYVREVLLSAARLYQGQTTNMRTRGGGFAPLIVVNNEDTTGQWSCETLIQSSQENAT